MSSSIQRFVCNIMLLLIGGAIGVVLQSQWRQREQPKIATTSSSHRNVAHIEAYSSSSSNTTTTLSLRDEAADRSLKPPPHSLPSSSQSSNFACGDHPDRCGFVYVHCSMNATVHAHVAERGIGEEGWWSAVLAASKLKTLVHSSSPVILMTNYDHLHVARLRRAFEGQPPGVVTVTSSDSLSSHPQSTLNDLHELAFGGGNALDSTTVSPLSSQKENHVIVVDESTRDGMFRLQSASLVWPFTHVVSLLPNKLTTTTTTRETDSSFVKPDVLRFLIQSERSMRDNSTTWQHRCREMNRPDSTLCELQHSVDRWLYMDTDTLLQNRTVDDLLRSAVPHAKRATRHKDHHHHIVYSVLDTLNVHHLAMVPEFGSQRNLGPVLYQDLLAAALFPEGGSDEASPYRYTFLVEQQYNTGLIAFLNKPRVRQFFDLWSGTHRNVSRCRADVVAWDQCSLPRALRRAANIKVAALWESFDVRDALGPGCSRFLYGGGGGGGAEPFVMRFDGAVLLHRHAAKGFMRKLMKLCWGSRFLDAFVYRR